MVTGQKHSGLGIASFVVSVVATVVMFSLFVMAGLMELSTPGGIDENSLGAAMLGLAIFATLFIDLVALGLGIAGLTQRDRDRIFAILGTCCACGTGIVTVCILIMGSIE